MCLRLLLFVLPLWLIFLVPNHGEASRLHQAWTELLQRHVANGLVDYQGFKKDESELDDYLEFLAETNPDRLERSDRLAFYINTYNAYTVKLILTNFRDGKPVASIKKIGGWFSSPWKLPFVVVGGKTYSLDNIEHDIIRVRFSEPRIHFAVNCASKSCPPLVPLAYEGDTLDDQLERSTRDFLSDGKNNYLKAGTLYVSSIFKWYGGDFNDDPISFFIAHAGSRLRRELAKGGDSLRVEFLDYDWSLNGQSQEMN